MSSPRFKKISVEEQHKEFVNEINRLKSETEGLKQLSEELINENMKLIDINEKLSIENETLLVENESLKNIISKLSFQSAGLTSHFLKLNCMSFDWEYIPHE